MGIKAEVAEEIDVLYSQGFTIRDIANMIGYSKTYVGQYLVGDLTVNEDKNPNKLDQYF